MLFVHFVVILFFFFFPLFIPFFFSSSSLFQFIYVFFSFKFSSFTSLLIAGGYLKITWVRASWKKGTPLIFCLHFPMLIFFPQCRRILYYSTVNKRRYYKLRERWFCFSKQEYVRIDGYFREKEYDRFLYSFVSFVVRETWCISVWKRLDWTFTTPMCIWYVELIYDRNNNTTHPGSITVPN